MGMFGARRRKPRTILLDGRRAPREILKATEPSLPTAERTPRMMAFDRTPSSPSLDPDTLSALRSVFGRSISDGSHPPELRELLCTAAREARDKQIPAERLLIVLKDTWHSLLAMNDLPTSSNGPELLQELISNCIREYYAL